MLVNDVDVLNALPRHGAVGVTGDRKGQVHIVARKAAEVADNHGGGNGAQTAE